MVRVEIRYMVDIFMLVVFVVCAATGFILWYAFPSGSGGGSARVRVIHDYSSLALTVAIIIHFLVNFNWIISVTKRIFKRSKT